MSLEVNIERNKNQRITLHVEEKSDDHNFVVQWKNGNRRREAERMRTIRRQIERQMNNHQNKCELQLISERKR